MKFKEYGRAYFRFFLLFFKKQKVILVGNKGKLPHPDVATVIKLNEHFYKSENI